MDEDMDSAWAEEFEATTSSSRFEQQPAMNDQEERLFIEQAIAENRKLIDLVFVQDCTGSQGSYITSATKNIELISSTIFESGKLSRREDLRIGLVAFRDHPPQDHTYVTKNFGFSSDVAKVHQDLSSLYASGGGDGPEAVTAAMAEALNMKWRDYATKMVILIADCPPHGLGEYGDGFDDGSPDGNDPLEIARQMAARGITLFFVACEPALSGYGYATDFYHAITSITSGLVLPLTTADLLAHAIVASVLENLDMEQLVREVGAAVAQRIHGNNESVDDVARELHEKLLLGGVHTKKVIIESIYRESPEAQNNVEAFMNSRTIAEARPFLKKVHGTRFTEKYLSSRQSYSRTAYSYSPYSYSSPPSSPPVTSSFKKATTTSSSSKKSSSPSRKVVTEFAAFGAPTNASVFGTAVASSPFSLAGNKAAFGGVRGGISSSYMDDDDDDDDNEGNSSAGGVGGGGSSDGRKQTVELREGSISLEQARRIAMQSAWRSARA